MEHEKQLAPLMIAGALVTRLIRECYESEGEPAVLELGRKTLVDADDETILLIAKGQAKITGVTPCCKLEIL